jgi:23S rRNA (adenine2030-N6)-methyltransferase
LPTPYRHHDHAGNFADVHKHWLLGLLLEHATDGEAPLHYLESHGGAGRYHQVAGNGFASGIKRLWQRSLTTPSINRYRQRIATLNPDGQLCHYPGSPLLAAQGLRRWDHATIVERSTEAFAELQASLGTDPRFTLLQGDGYTLIPPRLPQSAPFVLLVDPPFVAAEEFSRVAAWLPSLTLQPEGYIALWYPLSGRGWQLPMLHSLERELNAPWLRSEFHRHQAGGMAGSGMLLVNPPPGVEEGLQRDAMSLAALLRCDAVTEKR